MILINSQRYRLLGYIIGPPQTLVLVKSVKKHYKNYSAKLYVLILMKFVLHLSQVWFYFKWDRNTFCNEQRNVDISDNILFAK